MDHERGHDIDSLRDSIRLIGGKKKVQRGDLPPLLSDNNAVSAQVFFFFFVMDLIIVSLFS